MDTASDKEDDKMSKLVGNPNGIKLWNMMSESEDASEQEYFNRLNHAATKHGVVWFTDTVEQKRTGKNQTFFQLTWYDDKKEWEVSLFLVPEGGSEEIRDRHDDDWEYIDPEIIELAEESIS